MLLSLGSQCTHTCMLSLLHVCHCYTFVIAIGGPGLQPAVSLAEVPLFSLAPSLPAGLLTPSGLAPPFFLSSLSSLLSSPIISLAITTKLKQLVYSTALPPVPAKALEKIRANAYFDLKELLPDNAALLQHLQELRAHHDIDNSAQRCSMPERDNNPLTWILCFLSFIAAKTDVEETCDLIAYAQIILQLAW